MACSACPLAIIRTCQSRSENEVLANLRRLAVRLIEFRCLVVVSLCSLAKYYLITTDDAKTPRIRVPEFVPCHNVI